jgi:hypothetical protein
VRSVFTAAQLLHSLRPSTSARALLIREHAVDFVLDHREPPGVWRYFGKDALLAFGVLLSPDVDDTATAWAGLWQQERAVDPPAPAALRNSRTEAGLSWRRRSPCWRCSTWDAAARPSSGG